MRDVIVVGGGPAGMIAAAEAAKSGSKVLLLEKNEKLGKKLYITGKGRCNLTNDCDEETFIANVPGNPYFLYSAIYGFNSNALMNYIEALGVPLKTERGGRVFPVSEKASDITKALERNLKQHNVQVMLGKKVAEVQTEKGCVQGVATEEGDVFFCRRLIVATGGLSYPVTGSTGDGYRFAKACGHTVTKLYPSLTSLVASEKWIGELAGLSLKNIAVVLKEHGKKIYDNFGELLFTHTGVSGPVVLSASRFVLGKKPESITLEIDLKPALDEKALDQRLLRDFEKYVNKDFKNALDDLLPQKLIPVIIKRSGILAEKKVHDITKEERRRLLLEIKRFTLTISGTGGFEEAVVTAGGVDVNQIDPGTMESKLVKGLYFAGEVLDVDGYTGGFNLQIAFATGYAAGQMHS